MVGKIANWFRQAYNRFVHSIAFIPALMGIGFLALVVCAIELDVAAIGLKLSGRLKWLTLKDASTARTIVATIAGGIISLTVFSFSMVMVVMNQAASQMSNRMLDNIIGDRVQKVTLGFYIGTIVFSLYLLTSISDTDSALQIPSLSVYFLLLLTMADIFMFVYFLHRITQSFRYEQLIHRIHNRTINTWHALVKTPQAIHSPQCLESGVEVPSGRSGYYQGFNKDRLLKLATARDIVVEFLFPAGTYVLQGTPLLRVSAGVLSREDAGKLLTEVDFFYEQQISKNVYYGFFHLSEVAVKALSPGINDPGTAVLCINALTNLLSTVLQQPILNAITDAGGKTRIITRQFSFSELFHYTVVPVLHYGKNDPTVQRTYKRMLEQLLQITADPVHTQYLKSKYAEIAG